MKPSHISPEPPLASSPTYTPPESPQHSLQSHLSGGSRTSVSSRNNNGRSPVGTFHSSFSLNWGGSQQKSTRSEQRKRQENEKFKEFILFMDVEKHLEQRGSSDISKMTPKTTKYALGKNLKMLKLIDKVISDRGLGPLFWKYLWFQMVRRAQAITFMLEGLVTFFMVCAFVIPPIIAYFFERNDQWRANWQHRGFGLLFVFVAVLPPTFMAFRYDIPREPINSIGVIYLSVLFSLLLLAEFNKNTFIFPLISAIIIVSAPFLASTRNRILIFQALISLGIWGYRTKTGHFVDVCHSMLESTLLLDSSYNSSGGSLEFTRESVSIFVTSSQDISCNVPAMLPISRILFTIIFILMNMFQDAYQKRSFLALTVMHMDTINALAELENLEDFNEEQERHLREVLAKHGLENDGEANDDRLKADLKDVDFISKVGEGSFGLVWEGVYKGKPCAIKTLNGNEADSPNITRFVDEIKIMTKLQHPNIVPLVFGIIVPPKLCLGLEFAGYGDLTKVLKGGIAMSRHDKNFGMSWHNEGSSIKLSSIVTGLAAALKFCHSLDICHRDIKTENALVMSDGRCCLADFGEAKKLVSANNTIIGTPWYIAPEVYNGDEYNINCDVYSFGILLGVCLYGGSVSDFFWWDKPRKRSGFMASQYILKGWRPKVKDVYVNDMPTIVNLIKSCWVEDPSERPTMHEIWEVLAGWDGDRNTHRQKIKRQNGVKEEGGGNVRGVEAAQK